MKWSVWQIHAALILFKKNTSKKIKRAALNRTYAVKTLHVVLFMITIFSFFSKDIFHKNVMETKKIKQSTGAGKPFLPAALFSSQHA